MYGVFSCKEEANSQIERELAETVIDARLPSRKEYNP